MTITKADMVNIICEKMGFASKESMEIVDQVFGILKETLESGEKIKISGFGNSVVREKRPRKGSNNSISGSIAQGTGIQYWGRGFGWQVLKLRVR